MSPFERAFASARKQGLGEFTFNGKRYNTKYKEETGILERGNIDLTNRPIVRNPDGSISTVRSVGVNLGGQEVLLPTVSDDGRNLSVEQAVEQYRQTGRHLGKFANPEASTAYAQKLHQQQERMYANRVDTPPIPYETMETAPMETTPVPSIPNRGDNGDIMRRIHEARVAEAMQADPKQEAGPRNIRDIIKQLRGGD